MNEENFNTLLAHIAGNPHQFYMSEWWEGGRPKDLLSHKCGTTACIGGWLDALSSVDASPEELLEFVDTSARIMEWLGITEEQYDQLDRLFYMWDVTDENGALLEPKLCLGRFDKLPAEQRVQLAVKALQHWKETGEGNWHHILRQEGVLDYVVKLDQ